MNKYIKNIDKQKIIDYAQSSILELKIYDYKMMCDKTSGYELYTTHYGGIESHIWLTDFNYITKDGESSPCDTFCWVSFVYENLPEELKNHYAKEWNESFAKTTNVLTHGMFKNGCKLPITKNAPTEEPAK